MTPTQYNNEWLKEGNPKDKHCPIPVFLLFDTAIIEHHSHECILCEKTLAYQLSQELITNNIEDLNSFNYEKIYHVGAYNPNFEADIITRSFAEKEMLLYWLKSLNINKYNCMIKCCNELGFQLMFYKHNFYIDNVDLTDEYFKFQVMNNSAFYKMKIVVKCDNDSNRVFQYDVEKSKFELDFPKNSYNHSYKVKVVVDGEPMFAGEHIKSKKRDIIF